jgi:ZIP family zinc transporter
MGMEPVLIAFSLTLFAGLSTGIGSALAFFTKKTNLGFLSLALGFSAGVMLYVSFIEIFVKAKDSLTAYFGAVSGTWITVASFFGGILLIAVIDRLVPSMENPHEVHRIEELSKTEQKIHHEQYHRKLMRMGLFSALAIAIHNFPEGIATFTAALQDLSLGIPIAVAIAIHNIPEGIAVSIPVYYATGNRKKAFVLSFLSGLSEPVGALIGYAVLYSILNQGVFGIVFASVAGIMVYISLDELLPAAREYGKPHLAIYGLIAGMALMAISLLLFL